MATSASGLTRRRGAGAGAGANGDNDNDGSRVSSPVPRRNDDGPGTSYESSENGHKIAFDPRDISESAERSKQPKLTLMEEVLLMGLKDKQVGFVPPRPKGCLRRGATDNRWARATSLSGTTTFPMPSADASS